MAITFFWALNLNAQEGIPKYMVEFSTCMKVTSIPKQVIPDFTSIGKIPKEELSLYATFDLQLQGSFQYEIKPWLYAGVSMQHSFTLYRSLAIEENRRYSYMYDDGRADFYFVNDYRFTSVSPVISINILPKKNLEKLFFDFTLSATYVTLKTEFLTVIDEPLEVYYNFFGSGTEVYKRSGLQLSWQLGARWVDYFTEHWGYSVYLNYQPLTYRPKSMQLVTYELNGTDLTNTLTTREREYNFGNAEKDNPNNPNAPAELSTEEYRFRSFLFGVGINYRF